MKRRRKSCFQHKDGEKVLLDLYQCWIEAGSQLILTTTYPSTIKKFFNFFKSTASKRRNTSEDSIINNAAKELMIEKRIFDRACDCFNRLVELPYELIKSGKNSGKDVRLGLSIGHLSSTFKPISKEYSLFRFEDYSAPFYNNHTRELSREALEEFYLDWLRF
ncbi:hypothetical protein PPACK8108_LOCUS9001 [Phakopsora pachyrhizi]|uniref:Uncharacterized protein n=1 Tax=Phakopsora pachyrhizi TaxID=170000 RepID=A0AAV0AXJ2_PHAPC|nr:hypothetical protein PPACK8108_LOCUS9001 [Phakopsora pachyrhizi]